MTAGKPNAPGRWAAGLAAVALVWLLGVWPPPVWWRDHWPRETAMMRLRAGARYHPTALANISPLVPRMVIIGEDSRFHTHHGIDPAAVADALGLARGAGWRSVVMTLWRQRDRLRGASTITQQLAKNLYLSPSRDPLRKVKEAVTALRLELALRKDRILELYLNVVEWGPGIWGAQQASRAYFGVPAAQLDEAQAAVLAATLPHPLSSNPTFRPARALARRDLILARYHGADVAIPPEAEGDTALVVPAIPAVTIPPIDSVKIESPPLDTLPERSARGTRPPAARAQSTSRSGITSAM